MGEDLSGLEWAPKELKEYLLLMHKKPGMFYKTQACKMEISLEEVITHRMGLIRLADEYEVVKEVLEKDDGERAKKEKNMRRLGGLKLPKNEQMVVEVLKAEPGLKRRELFSRFSCAASIVQRTLRELEKRAKRNMTICKILEIDKMMSVGGAALIGIIKNRKGHARNVLRDKLKREKRGGKVFFDVNILLFWLAENAEMLKETKDYKDATDTLKEHVSENGYMPKGVELPK